MKVYISGVISNGGNLTPLQVEANKAKFSRAEFLLETNGHTVVNPLKLHMKPNPTWRECMETDIKALLECDAIYMLQGWENSKGARLEETIARELGLINMHHLNEAYR